MLTRSKSKGTNIGSSAADVTSPNQPSSVPERLSSVLGTGTVNSQVDSVHSPRVSESEPSSVTRQQKSSSAPNSYHSPRVSETELSGKNQQQQSSFAPIAHRPRSTSSSASNHTIKRMAAEARHAKAMLKILEAEKAAHNSILSAELAAIESCKSSRKSSCTNSVSSWVRSLPDNLDIPGPTINKSIIPEAVGPSVAIKPEQDVADFGLKDMKNLPSVPMHITQVHKENTADPNRFSSWLKMLRTAARAHRYIKILYERVKLRLSRTLTSHSHSHNTSVSSSHPISSILSCEDMSRAEVDIIRRSQLESFPEELRLLRANMPVFRRSRIARLSPILDPNGVLRISGRISAASNIPASAKQLIIMDGRHQSTRLLITHFHKIAAHGLNNFVINELRQKYWILHLRNVVRSVSLKCILCVIRKSKPIPPPTGDLPPERLGHHRRPFTFTGLDYMGPITVTVGRRREKRYIALFTCELVRDYAKVGRSRVETPEVLLAVARVLEESFVRAFEVCQ
ncbi:hypothetical protein ACJJTC_005503 [Scirpophaga incertulas]